ncbi:hypothetical protein [Polaribacter porphyrae]|uniref:Uncharacterized protein n=1 Tax=Polaribacter porphyrae TaxID=1137780 RepID=A0A2S7WJY1_9FLAO|nr:hypothetical protein [Polaribacter porphyrae]PQJ77910.1 hypothetical protein BTO18_01345 [Polaribacter porphyrae]
MKFYKISSVFIAFCLLSCDEKSSSNIYLYSFQKSKAERFLLEIKKENHNKLYFYSNKKDSIKDLNIVYNLEKDFLVSEKDTFYFIKKSYKTKDYEYKMYQPKTIKSHTITLVFHKNYGLLSSSVWGADFLFLKDSLSSFKNEAIFKEIMLEKNKIYLE